MNSRLRDVLNKHENVIASSISDITESIANLKILLNSNDVRLVTAYKSRNTEFKRLPPKVIIAPPSFIPQKFHTKQICQMFGSLSALSVKTEDFDYTETASKSYSSYRPFIGVPRIITDVKTDYGLPNVLRSISCLGDEYIWTCSGNNIMKLYNTEGEILKSIQTKSGNWPRDIAVLISGDLVYTDTEKEL